MINKGRERVVVRYYLLRAFRYSVGQFEGLPVFTELDEMSFMSGGGEDRGKSKLLTPVACSFTSGSSDSLSACTDPRTCESSTLFRATSGHALMHCNT